MSELTKKPRTSPECDSVQVKQRDLNENEAKVGGRGDIAYNADDFNGSILSGVLMPNEVLINILTRCDEKSIVAASLVCKLWYELITDCVWKYKAEEIVGRALPRHEWKFYAVICLKRPFDKNLIRNHSGEKQLNHWHITANGGDRWKVENPPVGSNNLPDLAHADATKSNKNTCFVTSFSTASKQQTIDLMKLGLYDFVNKFKTPIYISEMHAGRFDCGGRYVLHVTLMNSKREEIVAFDHQDTFGGNEACEWRLVEHVFKEIEDVRYVTFMHTGRDTQTWAGHYGTKMARACVKLMLPSGDS